jgi:hypothetical protein
LRVEAYFQQVRAAVEACPEVQAFDITFDKRGTSDGFIRGDVFFVDGSTLHLREFVDVATASERLTYVYQYMDPDRHLVFRYDNTGHHRRLNLSTVPRHKHLGDEMSVVASPAPTLETVLAEIESLIDLPRRDH